MLARIIPVLLLCACATTAQLPMVDQPVLARNAQSDLDRLRAVGIARMVSPGNGAMVRLETAHGPVYVRYPPELPALAFTVDVGVGGVRGTAATVDTGQEARVLAALVPEAVRVTAANNQLEWFRANPLN
jgi:hypothetical protein